MDTSTTTLAECGEIAFIEAIKHEMPGNGGPFLRSVGDDCLETAAISGKSILATTDTFVDTVHFNREFFSFGEIGARCMSASVSDIAAMAGSPLFSLLSLSMPKSMRLNDAVSLFRGLKECADRYGCTLAGGETTSTPGPLTVTVTVIGTADPGKALYRSGARPGDSIYVSGTIGDAMAGLMAFTENVPGYDSLKRKFIAPDAEVELAKTLAGQAEITAMIDISDGVATDIMHICEESGSGAAIEASLLPLSKEYREFAEGRIDDRILFALRSGEEFALLFTSPDSGISERIDTPGSQITRIGTITDMAGNIELIREAGKTETLQSGGYEHFKS